MAAVGAVLAADLRRTLDCETDAQLRQLLIAAEIDAPAHLADPANEKWVTPLPPSLAADGRVEIRRIVSVNGVNLVVTASARDRSLSEQLQFDRAADGWNLIGADLFPAVGRP